MATNAEKMIQLVRERAYYGVPENAPGVCMVCDEDNNQMLKFGFDAHRDYIKVVGYEAADEVSVDVCAALAALCGLVDQKPVMTAYSYTEEMLAAELSDNGEVDAENRMAVSMAMAMLKEAIHVYSRIYVEKKAMGEEWHGNA